MDSADSKSYYGLLSNRFKSISFSTAPPLYIISATATNQTTMSSTLVFATIPPSDDDALLSILGSPRPLILRFKRPGTLMREIVRVAKCCSRHPIVDIAVPDMSMLKGFEALPLCDEVCMPDVETASYAVKFQQGCPLQMERLCRFLQTHRSIRTLSLSLFEYPKDYAMRDVPQLEHSLFAPLPALLSRKEQLFLDDLFGPQICNGELAHFVDRLLAPECRTRHEVPGVFYSLNLPERLERLTLRAPIQGPTVRRDFLFVLPNLVSLDLSYCSIDDAAFDVIGPVLGQRLPRLETLVLARNRLHQARLAELVGQSLVEVDLSYNPVTSKAVHDLFEGLENTAAPLRIDLSCSSIVEQIWCIGVGGVQGQLPNCVRSLDLTSCAIHDAAFPLIAPFIAFRMPGLERLTMACNRIQNARLGELLRNPLRWIDLSRNPITSRAASSLLMAMEGNASLGHVDLSHTCIAAEGLEFERIQHWRARPALLRMPDCFEGQELWRAMEFVPEGVELCMEGVIEEREMIVAP